MVIGEPDSNSGGCTILFLFLLDLKNIIQIFRILLWDQQTPFQKGKGRWINTVTKIGRYENAGKNEFLRLYYTLWNRITFPNHRVIVDAHTDSGIVNFLSGNGEITQIYGSAFLAILKTLMKSRNLTILLNEQDTVKFQVLEKNIDEVRQNGIPVFEEIQRTYLQKTLFSDKTIKIKKRMKRKFPDSVDEEPPLGFQKVLVKSRAKVVCFNSAFEDKIDVILNGYFNDVIKINKKDGKEKILKVKGLFFLDVKTIDWNVIHKIGRKMQDNGGIELILSHKGKHINQTLARILNELQVYWVEVKICSIYQSLESKKARNPKEVLLFCSNHQAGIAIAEGKFQKIAQSIKLLEFSDITSFFSKK